MSGCGCKQAVHVHGVLGMYNRHGCRCQLCRAAKSAQQAPQQRSNGELREELDWLRSFGMSADRIAERLCVDRATVVRYLQRERANA